LVAASQDSGEVVIYEYLKEKSNPINGKPIFKYMHKACVTKVAWADSENGCVLASACHDKSVVLHTRGNNGE